MLLRSGGVLRCELKPLPWVKYSAHAPAKSGGVAKPMSVPVEPLAKPMSSTLTVDMNADLDGQALRCHGFQSDLRRFCENGRPAMGADRPSDACGGCKAHRRICVRCQSRPAVIGQTQLLAKTSTQPYPSRFDETCCSGWTPGRLSAPMHRW
jgi:hypothetical protein